MPLFSDFGSDFLYARSFASFFMKVIPQGPAPVLYTKQDCRASV
jgi:hypothetical protein